MYLAEMFVAIVVIVVGDHFIGSAFEAHAFAASAAGDSIASIIADDGDAAFGVGASSDSVFLHVFFEEGLTAVFGLLAGHSGVILHLDRTIVTLHSMQKLLRQTSQEMWSPFMGLTCLQPALKQNARDSACLVTYWLIAIV